VGKLIQAKDPGSTDKHGTERHGTYKQRQAQARNRGHLICHQRKIKVGDEDVIVATATATKQRTCKHDCVQEPVNIILYHLRHHDLHLISSRFYPFRCNTGTLRPHSSKSICQG
jgi:hypothetical protein